MDLLLDRDLLHRVPKIVLHDHLDGGLRPTTVIELAEEVGHELPSTDPDELAAWFYRGDKGADLLTYLAAFEHTVAVMQTREGIERVARECAEDLDADGVIYAEVRFAAELATSRGLSIREVLEAIAAGFDAGPDTIELRQIVCSLRHTDHAAEAFGVAAASRDLGVVGIDMAGPEVGHPLARHAQAIEAARAAGLHVTFHAGEASGPDSVAEALDHGAERIGHGVRLIEDVASDGTLGPVVRRVLAGDVTLDVCPTSNVHTGVTADVAGGALERLRRLGVRVTVNPDDRLMSDVTATSELLAVTEAFGYQLDDIEELTRTALAAAWVDEPTRQRLTERVDRGFAALRP